MQLVEVSKKSAEVIVFHGKLEKDWIR